jgi:hypothetical protein
LAVLDPHEHREQLHLPLIVEGLEPGDGLLRRGDNRGHDAHHLGDPLADLLGRSERALADAGEQVRSAQKTQSSWAMMRCCTSGVSMGMKLPGSPALTR